MNWIVKVKTPGKPRRKRNWMVTIFLLLQFWILQMRMKNTIKRARIAKLPTAAGVSRPRPQHAQVSQRKS